MEKPTGIIQKIIESLQQINALDVYSPIEKDIILHNLRAAYMIFLNIPIEENGENRVEKLSFENEEWRMENGECDVHEAVSGERYAVSDVEVYETPEETIEEIQETLVEEIDEEDDEEDIELYEMPEEIIDEMPETSVETIDEILETSVETVEDIQETPATVLYDDIQEFIPDAKPNLNLLFEETPKPEKRSLNDLLTEKKEENTLGARFQHTSIPDLTKAIGVNEKFTFIRELFCSSGVDFSSAIQKLNECKNIETAFVLMEELKHQYLWDTTSISYLSLCDLVRRRFL